MLVFFYSVVCCISECKIRVYNTSNILIKEIVDELELYANHFVNTQNYLVISYEITFTKSHQKWAKEKCCASQPFICNAMRTHTAY